MVADEVDSRSSGVPLCCSYSQVNSGLLACIVLSPPCSVNTAAVCFDTVGNPLSTGRLRGWGGGGEVKGEADGHTGGCNH